MINNCKFVLVLIIIFQMNTVCHLQIFRILDKIRDSQGLIDQLSTFLEMQSMLNHDIKSSLFTLYNFLKENLNINESKCVDDLTAMLIGSIAEENWALSMLDSAGKLGKGVLRGNLLWTGSYSQCRSIKVQENITHEKSVSFSGRYCWAKFEIESKVWKGKKGRKEKMLVDLKTNYPVKLRVDFCVPDSCSAGDVKSTLNTVSELSGLKDYIPSIDVFCFTNDNNIWNDTRAIISLVIISSFIILMFVSTIYDVFYYRRIHYPSVKYSHASLKIYGQSELLEDPEIFNETMDLLETVKKNKDDASSANDSNNECLGIYGRMLLSFSVYANGAKILTLSSESENLAILNGIRFFSMIWIIMGHTCLCMTNYSDNFLDLLNFIRSFGFQFIDSSTMAVDSFFILSGLLLTYLFLKEYDRTKGKISWLQFYFHRFWRLSPNYFLLLFLLWDNLSKYFGSGPFWPQNGFDGEKCKKNWWWNVLYINNFLPEEKMCLTYSWYLACDMQFFILSPLILIPLAKRFLGLGISICLLLILFSCGSSGYLSYHYGLSASFEEVELDKSKLNVFDIIIDKPYCHIGSYAIGIIIGWILYKTKCKLFMPKIFVIVGWILSIACFVGVTFGLYKAHPSQISSSLCYALRPLAWSLGLSWLIITCCCGYGGMVTQFLSWPVWHPLSRLTYSVYLVHYFVIEVVFSNFQTPFQFTQLNVILYGTWFIVVSYIFGFIISLAFESPFLRLEKIFLKRKPS